ncbi:MAG: hypothetical protein IJZ96_03530, partial [Lachnospiraceae bacterium]|nr:hypothetical protein [Lachnospiraceae bacterium]
LDTIATIYDTIVQIKDIMQSADGSALDVAWALGTGLISGIFLNKMCSLKKIGPVVSKIVIAFGMVTELQGIFEAVEEGDWGAVASRTIHLLTSIVSLSQSCFTGETLVATESGQVRIDEIELGDKVWAYNVETGETELKTVTKIYVHEVDEILHLYTSEGQIDTTTNHPFYVVEKGWVAAGDLKSGDKVLKLNGTVAVVTGSELEKLSISILVYNLEVEDFHTYFVGNEPVLVHNYEGDGKKPDVDEDGSGTKPDGDFEAPKVTTNSRGELTNGAYTIDAQGMVKHIDGTSGKSQFLYDVDADKAVLDAAAYADKYNLWKPNTGNPADFANKAKVYVTNGPVGVTGSGQLTSYINVYRTKTGYVHGSPGN